MLQFSREKDADEIKSEEKKNTFSLNPNPADKMSSSEIIFLFDLSILFDRINFPSTFDQKYRLKIILVV